MANRFDPLKAVVPRDVRQVMKLATRAAAQATAGARPLPEFLVIGAKRGGTTSFWNYLISHPSVLPIVPAVQNLKSSHYFDLHYHRGEAYFRSHFATRWKRRRAERLTRGPAVAGEASPYYLFDHRVPRRVADLMPAVKAIVLLRDPVTRAYSHYWERVDQGVEPLSFRQALAAEPARTRTELERMDCDPYYYSRNHDWYSYRERGVYLPQLLAWHRALGAEQILVLRSEDFYRDPQAVLDSAVTWLGLSTARLQVGHRHNARPAPAMEGDVRDELAEYYRESNAALETFLGVQMGWTV